MQQRASIARALSFDADLLLMDEPFGALDEIVRDHLNEQLLKLWARTNKTVAFVTHSIPEAVYLSTKIVVMSPRPGRIIDVIKTDFPKDRGLDIRETPEFLEVAHRVRKGCGRGIAMTSNAATMNGAIGGESLWSRLMSGQAGPVTVVLIALFVIWYIGAVFMNAPTQIDRYNRAGETWTTTRLIEDTLAQERPILPAPHQVAQEMYKTILRLRSRRNGRWFTIPG